MKKSIRILSILMAFVMLIGSFSVLGSAYDAFKGSDIVGIYNDVDTPAFTLDQYASMGLDEVDRMLAKEQLELDLFGLLYLDLTSINATVISVEQFLATGDVLLDMLGDLKTLPSIVAPLLGLRRTEGDKDIRIIYAVFDVVANLRTIASKYVKGDPNNPLDAGLLNGLISGFMFDVRELAIGLVYGFTKEGDAKEFDYFDEMSLDKVPADYKGDNAILNLAQALLTELVLGEWKMIDEELDNKCSVLMKGSYAWKDEYGNDVSDEEIDIYTYDYYAWVHPSDWVTVGLGGATRVWEGEEPAPDLGCVDITTDTNGYDFIERLMQTAYNYLLVPVITRDTVDWVLELCGYSFDETKTQRTKFNEETGEWEDNDDYDPNYHGYIAAEEDLTKIADLFNHEGLADGSIRMPKVTIPAGETLVDNFNTILGEFAELVVVPYFERDGVSLEWTWDYEGGNAKLFHNIAELGKFVVFVTDDLFFNKRSRLPSAEEIAGMDNDQQIVALVMREILNNSVDYIYVDESYDTVVDVAYRATEQLAWQDIPQYTYTKPVRSSYATDAEYYEAVVIKMIDILFDIAVYNLNQGFDMNPANGTNPVTDTGLLQYQGGDAELGSYENNLALIASWAFKTYAAILPFEFNSAKDGIPTADEVWEDIDTILNAIIPIKGEGAWINEEIAGDGSQIVSKNFIFNYILQPLYCLDATNFAKIFARNENGAFAEMNGVEIIIDLLDGIFDLLFPNVFQKSSTLDGVVQNEPLSEMIFDLIGTLGYSQFTNSQGVLTDGRAQYIVKTGLPLICLLLGLSDDQEFEEMEIYLPEIIDAKEEQPTFKVFNGSSGINTGYTAENGKFTQDNLYQYVVRQVSIKDYPAAGGDDTRALTVKGIVPGTTLSGGENVDVQINGRLTEGNLIEFQVRYIVLGEDGTSITGVDNNGDEILLTKTVYAYVGSTDEDDDAIEESIDAGNGRSIKYEKAMYLDGGDDLDDIEGRMIRVVDLSDDGKTTGTAYIARIKNSSVPFATVNDDESNTSVALEGKGGTYFLTPFDVAVKEVTDEGEFKYYERFEYTYATDEDGNVLYDEETNEPIIAVDENGDYIHNDGVVDGLYTMTAVVNVAGNEVDVPVRVHIYDDFGLESAFERAVAANRQKSNYNLDDHGGIASEIYDHYIDLLKDVAKFVLKPKNTTTFEADISATSAAAMTEILEFSDMYPEFAEENFEFENMYEFYRSALDFIIEYLESYALNQGTDGLKNAYNVKSGLNYEIRYDNEGRPYRYDYKYYEDGYKFFGMRDFVPHTYNRYKDARGRVADLINSQERFVMAPSYDADIYGEDYVFTAEEQEAYEASIAKYEEEVANLGVVDSIDALYALHMIELTGDRLIALPANISKLVDVYAMCGNAVEPGTEGQYTASSLEAYQHAEEFTEEILAAGADAVVPSQVNTATTELVYAWKRLEVCADYSALDAAIAEARPTVEANGTDATAQSTYTEESYKTLLDAYDKAINIDRDLGASDNTYLGELADALTKALNSLEFAQASEPTFEISFDEVYANPTWDVYTAAYLNEDAVSSLGGVLTIDQVPVDAFLVLGNGIYSEDDITKAFTNVENAEFVITPNENGAYGTGTVVQICDTEYTPYYTYFVVVRGDVNGDGDFNDVDAAEMDLAGNYEYDWFWNMYETYDQYKSCAGDTNGDAAVDSVDGELLGLAYNYQGYYDMVYGGEM